MQSIRRFAILIFFLVGTPAFGQERVVTPLPAPVGYGYTLARVTGLAMANSPVLRQAWARVEQARGLAIQAGLYPNPTKNSGNPNQLGGDNSLYSVGVTQEYGRAGKIRLNQAAAEQTARQANLDFIHQRFANVRQSVAQASTVQNELTRQAAEAPGRIERPRRPWSSTSETSFPTPGKVWNWRDKF